MHACMQDLATFHYCLISMAIMVYYYNCMCHADSVQDKTMCIIGVPIAYWVKVIRALFNVLLFDIHGSIIMVLCDKFS